MPPDTPQPDTPQPEFSQPEFSQPEFSQPESSLAESVLSEPVVAGQAAGELIWVKNHLSTTDADQAALGLERVRLLQQMRRPLPLSESELAGTPSVYLRAFQIEDDDAGLLRVNNRAFAWHPDQSGWDSERLHAQTRLPEFDPRLLLIHEGESGAIDGFCWTKIHPATQTEPACGEIYVIAADPDTHGTGLGRALTVGGLKLLSAHGLQVGMLYVESDNEPAIKLYDRLGFTVHHFESAYRAADSAL
jgi:mycothiol synthase